MAPIDRGNKDTSKYIMYIYTCMHEQEQSGFSLQHSSVARRHTTFCADSN